MKEYNDILNKKVIGKHTAKREYRKMQNIKTFFGLITASGYIKLFITAGTSDFACMPISKIMISLLLSGILIITFCSILQSSS